MSKIVHVGGIAGPGPVAGGVWRVALEQTAHLSRRHEVLLFGGWLGAVPQERAEHNFKASKTILVRLRRPFPGARLRGLFSTRWPLIFWRAAGAADVVHVHLARDYFATTAMIVSHLRGRRTVAQPHGMVRRSSRMSLRLFDLVFRTASLRCIDVWLALSEGEEGDLRNFGVPGWKIHRIVNSVPHRANTWSPVYPPEFGFISRLDERKRPLTFVAAAIDVLRGREANFTLAGPDQGQLPAVRLALQSPTTRGAIEYVGELTPAEVSLQLSRLTALVLPSVGEMFPMIAVEAMAQGTPVILTDDSGISPILAAQDAALIREPNAPAIADAMRLLLDSPDLARRISRNGRNLSRAAWSSSAMEDALLTAYHLPETVVPR